MNAPCYERCLAVKPPRPHPMCHTLLAAAERRHLSWATRPAHRRWLALLNQIKLEQNPEGLEGRLFSIGADYHSTSISSSSSKHRSEPPCYQMTTAPFSLCKRDVE